MKAPVGLLSDRTVLRQQDGGAPPRQVPRLRAQRSKESPSGAFKRQNGPASAGWRGPAPTSSAFASAAQQGKPQWGFQATNGPASAGWRGPGQVPLRRRMGLSSDRTPPPAPTSSAFASAAQQGKAPVGLSSDRTVLRQQDGGAPPRQVPRLRAQRSKESPSGAFKRQNGPASAGWRPRPDKFRVCERSAARKAPVGLSSDRTVLRQQDGGAPPRQVPRLRAQRSKESPSGDFRCFSLTNTLPVCYLYSIETASLLTERCGAPQCRAAGMSMPTVWAALRNCCAKLSFFAIKEDV